MTYTCFQYHPMRASIDQLLLGLQHQYPANKWCKS